MGGRKKKSKRQSDGSPEQSLPSPFVLFLDETIHRCLPIRAALEKTKTEFVPHESVFRSGVRDTEWLAEVGDKQWVVLTSDKRIRFNELERNQVIEHGVREFVFSSGNLNGEMMGAILEKAMPRIREIIEGEEGPFIACITKSGNVEVRYDKDGSVYARKKKANETDQNPT